MIDRDNRDKLIVEIQNFLNEKTDSFEFDENIFEIQSNTKDETIDFIVTFLWYFYDDIKSHKVTIEKSEWDAIQRLLLILKSDKEITEKIERKYTLRQAISAGLLALSVFSYFYVGYSIKLLFIFMGLGIISMSISWWKNKTVDNNEINWQIYPFSSISELLKLRREQKSFRKQAFNKKIENRRIRSTLENIFLQINFRLYWLIFSPLVLFYQSLPEANKIIEIKEAA